MVFDRSNSRDKSVLLGADRAGAAILRRVCAGITMLILSVSLFCVLPLCGFAESTSADFTMTMQIDNPVMTVNGVQQEIDPGRGTAPVIVNGRTLVPIRTIIEAMGGTVEWNGDTQTAALTYGGDEIRLTINSTTAYLNNEANTLDTAPAIINERTMLPIRFIAESFKFSVDWNENERIITISTQAEPSEAANIDEPITIHEGEISQRRFAREGDTVIKADGTAVVLKKGAHGILGEGQGVAPDLGLETPTGFNKRVEAYKVFSGTTDFKDSTGKSVINAPYYVNKLTGEGHWGSEWMAMTSEPTTAGTFEYQLSEDKNWIWLGGGWIDMSVQNPTDAELQTIRDANGLD